jgi:hypothetical protein
MNISPLKAGFQNALLVFADTECGSKYQTCGACRGTLHFVWLERSWSLKKVQNLNLFPCHPVKWSTGCSVMVWFPGNSRIYLLLKYGWTFFNLLFYQMTKVPAPSDDLYILSDTHRFQACSQNCMRRIFVSSCLSVRMEEQFGSYRTDSPEIWYLRSFRNSVEKFQVLLKSDSSDG